MNANELTIEEKNYCGAIAGLISRHGFADVRTDKIELFLQHLKDQYYVTAVIDRSDAPGRYMLSEKLT